MVANGHDPDTGKVFTAKKLRELLALKGIHNDFELMGDDPVPFIMYRNGYKKKNVISAWQVLVNNRRTDPEGQYRDGFNKTFVVDADAQVSALGHAKAWASQEYDVTDWVKTPFGSWTSQAHLQTRLGTLMPETFDPDYRDPAVMRAAARFISDDSAEDRMFRVTLQLYAKPESPLYVLAKNTDDARRQVTQLFVKVAGTRVLDGLKIFVNET